MKKLILSIIAIISSLNTQLNAQFDYYNNLYSDNGAYVYYDGASAPSSNWMQRTFTETGWKTGTGVLGYGESNVVTETNLVNTLYLRTHFYLTNVGDIQEAIFFADFDDGFVAYLNGVEIARVNLGKKGDIITHNQYTDRSHESVYCREFDRPVCGYYIDPAILSTALINGDNVIAVRVHNDSIDGSDLCFNSCLSQYFFQDYNVWAGPFRFYAQVPLDSSKFPIIIINTDEYGFPQKKIRYDARMSVIYNPSTENYKPTDPFTDLNNGLISIEIRGNSTSDMPKHSFNLETQNEDGSNNNVSLLGMPPDDDWILYAPFADKSLIRNELAFYLGRVLGYYEPRTRFCELILNGEYQGLYVLTEKIKRNANRVNISQNDFTATGGIAVSGGYVLRLGDGDVYPKLEDRTVAQTDYITDFRNSFFGVLNSPETIDPVNGFRKYVNEQYLIDYILANELMKNIDAYMGSTYLVKDRDDIDGKLKFGPIWDNDLSLGNTNYNNMPNDWMFDLRQDLINMTHFLCDTALVNDLADRWVELRASYYSNENLVHCIDSISNYIDEARIRNYKVWPLLNVPLLWPSYIPSSYEFEVDTMKQWIVMRANWIDANIRNISYQLPTGIPDFNNFGQEEISLYPAPFNSYLNIRCKKADINIDGVEIKDISGRTLCYRSTESFNNGIYQITGLEGLKRGAYLIVLKNGQEVIMVLKSIKM